jgi:pimeloyl-ACP methyl ester carboxylesterase
MEEIISSPKCSSCQIGFNPLLFQSPSICPIAHGGCGKSFCSKCIDYACCTEADGKKYGMKASIYNFCKECFKKVSNVDFERTFTVYGPEKGTSRSIVFVHGGGGCRRMFDYHAKHFSEKKGYRCVLIDMPGHGSRIDEKLTFDTAIAAIHEAVTDLAGNFGDTKPIVVGGSLGGYILMEYVGRFPDAIDVAVVTMCGQAVGVERGWMAGFGLWALGSVSPLMGSKGLLSALVAESGRNAQLEEDLVLEGSLRNGMFFHQADAQIAILKASHPAATLPLFPGRILFINGSKDHRDSEQRWLGHSKAGKLLVYEGGDHFFSHDKRFLSRFLDDLENFFQPPN